MVSLEQSVAERWWAFKLWRAMVLTALGLGVLAFILAQWPPVRRVGVADLETDFVGLNLVIAGAFPWLLQWGSLAMLFVLLMGRLGHIDRQTTIAVVVFPLVVGSSWWIGIAVTHWGDDPLDFIVNSTMWSISRKFGEETLAQCVLFEVLGPLTCPLMLRGPYGLAGWSFLWTALSTVVVMLLLSWTARKLADMRHRRHSSLRRLAFVCAVVLIYKFPVLLRGLVRVVSGMQST